MAGRLLQLREYPGEIVRLSMQVERYDTKSSPLLTR